MAHSRIFTLLLALAGTLFFTNCTNDTVDPPDGGLNLDDYVIWSGAAVTFEKEDNTDATLEANQDRITGNVWLTRGTDGGQIFNAVSENSAVKESSPEGTLWAIGTTDNLFDLEYDDFRTTVGQPKNNLNRDLVLLLVDDNIAIDIKFTSWSQGMAGGFAYERSSN